ncbi:MAG: hypothetical protein IKE17_15535, partial [Clostridia bacterium]|nr:hypothetical protein [Clostridia bacterium]
PEQKRLPCRFAARKSPAISGKSEEDVLKGDLSPFKRAQARDKSEFPCVLYHATAVFYFPIAFLGGV